MHPKIEDVGNIFCVFCGGMVKLYDHKDKEIGKDTRGTGGYTARAEYARCTVEGVRWDMKENPTLSFRYEAGN